MKMMRTLGFALTVAAAFLLSGSDAAAQPVAGAYYAGSVTGCGETLCGTVSFTVSQDASKVKGFKACNVPGEGCQFQCPTPFPFDLDIVDDAFGPGLPGFFEVSGSFPSEGSAEGTLRLAMGEPLCDTGVLDWTATVVPLPVGGIAELPDASASSGRNRVALAALAALALVALTTGAWYARRWLG